MGVETRGAVHTGWKESCQGPPLSLSVLTVLSFFPWRTVNVCSAGCCKAPSPSRKFQPGESEQVLLKVYSGFLSLQVEVKSWKKKKKKKASPLFRVDLA